MVQSLLQQVGLTSAEAKVYLGALKVGTQAAGFIAKEAGLPPKDTLQILTYLEKRGVIRKLKQGQAFFTAEPPAVAIKILARPYLASPSFKDFQKDLETYRDPAFTKPKLTFYDGKEGILEAYEDTLTSKTDILAIASIDDTENLFPRYVPRYYKRRKTAGILIKAIFPDTPLARERQKKDTEELRVSRLIPADKYHFSIEMNIYDDKVAYFSLKERMAVILRSAAIAESMRNMFNMSWEMAEHYQDHCLRENERPKPVLGFI